MKKLFYVGLIVLAIFEFVKVYWIMPLPGSQQMETVDLSYFLHTYPPVAVIQSDALEKAKC